MSRFICLYLPGRAAGSGDDADLRGVGSLIGPMLGGLGLGLGGGGSDALRSTDWCFVCAGGFSFIFFLEVLDGLGFLRGGSLSGSDVASNSTFGL